jgi:hypothetical protein
MSGGDGVKVNSNRLLDVSTKTLEGHLSVINKTLKRHEHELKHPVWMETIRGEFDSLARLRRRMDLSESDVNNIRQVVFTSGTLAAIEAAGGVDEDDFIEQSSDSNSVAKIEYIPDDRTALTLVKTDIEKLRHVARRLELHKASESVLLPHIEGLSKLTANHELRIVELEKSDELEKLKEELLDEVGDVRDLCEDVEQDVQEQMTETGFRLDQLEHHTETFTKMFSGDLTDEGGGGMIIPNLAEIERRFVSKEVFEERVGKAMKDQVSGTEAAMIKLQSASLRRACGDAVEPLSTILNRALRAQVQRAWDRLMAMNDHHNEVQSAEMRKVAGRVRHVMKKFLAGPAVSLFFKHWKKFVQWGDLIHSRRFQMTDIVIFWRGRLPAFIDMRAWLHRWRRNSKIEAVAVWARSRLRVSDADDDEAMVRPDKNEHAAQAARHMESMQGDDHGRLVMLGFLTQGLSSMVDDAVGKGDKAAAAVTYLEALVKDVKESSVSTFTARMDGLEKRATNESNMTQSRLDNLEMLHSQRLRARAAEQGELQTRLQVMEERLAALESGKADHEKKLRSALTLQGELIDTFSRLEKTQKSLKKDVHAAREVADEALAMGKGVRTDASTNHTSLVDRVFVVDEMLTSVNHYVKESTERLTTLEGVSGAAERKIDNVNETLSTRVKHIQDYVATHVMAPPSAGELVALCHGYEHKVDSSQSTGSMSTAFPPQLALQLARYAQRLAGHIAHTADIAVLNVMVVGPQPAPPRSGEVPPKAGLEVPRSGGLEPRSAMEVNAHMGSGAPEDDAFAMREELLQSFHEEFMASLAAGDKDNRVALGYARTEARAVFHRRFLSTLDLAMSKHDSTVMTAPSTFGNRPANPPGGSCVACDRPLRMRYRARPLTYLTSQQALFDAAGEQLKGDTTHQSAYSKLHSSQSTPFIGGTSLRGPESGGGMSMSAAERQQQDATTDGGGGAGSRRPGSANPLKRTNRSDASSNKSQTGNGSTYGRPASAGATRHRTAVKTAAIGDASAFVMRSGFKMPVLREQELLAAKLTNNFPKDASVSRTAQVYPPPHTCADMDTQGTGNRPNDYANNFEASFKRPADEAFDFGPRTSGVLDDGHSMTDSPVVTPSFRKKQIPPAGTPTKGLLASRLGVGMDTLSSKP